MSFTTIDEKELQTLCQEWQERLGLGHWQVVVKIKRYYDMDNYQGSNLFTYSKMQSVIKIIHPDDWDPDCMCNQDMEKTLVHELLHILLHPLAASIKDDDYLKQDILEQIIETLSRALVDLKRRGMVGLDA